MTSLPNLPHRIDIPNQHPGVSDDPEKNLISLLVRRSFDVPENHKTVGSGMKACVHPADWPTPDIVFSLRDSAELAAFLHRNTHPRDGIIAAQNHGLSEAVDEQTLAERLCDQYELPPESAPVSITETRGEDMQLSAFTGD